LDKDSEHFDWTVRNAVYAAILERTVPPSAEETAAALGVSPDDVRAAYERLNDRHALFLTPGSHDVRMAHPFSGVPTAFRVESGGRAYWANCAWDALGIPAALHSDARIEAPIADGESIRLAIEAGRVKGWDGVVHYPLPFRRWYDDLIET
jgi:DNA-binding transcriptional MocR family regulator